VAACVILTPAMALAASNNPNGPDMDVRLQSYPTNVFADGSTALTWMLGILLMAVCIGGVFKSAKRTHLD
jgi:hypothetical protein